MSARNEAEMADESDRTSSLRARQARKNNRIRTACVRCQRRKTRCDGGSPSCLLCRKSDSRCIYEDSRPSSDASRIYIIQLERRVKWLESIVRTRCPDVDLSNEPNDRGEAEATRRRPGGDIRDDHRLSLNEPNVDVSELQTEDTVSPQHVRRASLQQNGTASSAPPNMAHEIGLVSLSTGNDPKYIGPSSGYFFTQLVMAASAKTNRPTIVQSTADNASSQDEEDFAMEVIQSTRSILPETREMTVKLSETYFKTIHQHLPFLHQPTHNDLINSVYDVAEPDAMVSFQVYMVLAISSLVLSRRKRLPLPSEGWCARAMTYFSKVSSQSSMKGLQCLLLMLVYATHSPSTKLNVWYLNYQCIAMVVDLGLQRDVATAATITPLEQEMRTRLFWAVYSFDRSICTMMGRPIGLRDEACELRLPADLDDKELTSTYIKHRENADPPTHMSYAIHMFKLARINSEIKYVLHSISRDTPSYAYPAIRSISEWQAGVLAALDRWVDEIPSRVSRRDYVVKLCEIRYHSLKTLLLRPSPAMPQPTPDALKQCYKSAICMTRLYYELYRDGSLVFSWDAFHSIMMGTITIFFCIWTTPDIARQIELDTLISDLRSVSNVLSAIGEYWSGAKRSRDLLDGLASKTIASIMEIRAREAKNANTGTSSGQTLDVCHMDPIHTGERVAPLQSQDTTLRSIPDPITSLFDHVTDPSTDFWFEDLNTDTLLQDLLDGNLPTFTDMRGEDWFT